GVDDDGESHGTGQSLWRILPLTEAMASTGPGKKLVARLNRCVPEKGQIHEYLPVVRDLLHHTALKVTGDSDLDRGLHDMFRDMVLATAWQETCWRQFVRSGDKVAPVTSAGGAVGIMQVIPAVWRGFYDGKSLAGDIAYNAAAAARSSCTISSTTPSPAASTKSTAARTTCRGPPTPRTTAGRATCGA